MILRNVMYIALDALIEEAGEKSNFMIVAALIAEFEKIEVVKQGDGIYKLGHAVAATQNAERGPRGVRHGRRLREGAARQLSAELEAIRKGA